MDDSLNMSFAESGTDLPCDVQNLRHFESTGAVQKFAQAVSIYEFHGNESRVLQPIEVINAADVMMGDAARQAQLIAESLHKSGIIGQRRFQDLKRQHLARFPIARFIYDPHASATQLVKKVIAQAQ